MTYYKFLYFGEGGTGKTHRVRQLNSKSVREHKHGVDFSLNLVINGKPCEIEITESNSMFNPYSYDGIIYTFNGVPYESRINSYDSKAPLCVFPGFNAKQNSCKSIVNGNCKIFQNSSCLREVLEYLVNKQYQSNL